MEACVKCDRLIHEPEIAIELLEMTTHGRELTGQCHGIAEVILRSQLTIEGLFDQSRFVNTVGRFSQTRGHAVGEIDANSGFHVKIPLKRR